MKYQYFRINIDHRFTEVFAEGLLTGIDTNAIRELLMGNGDVRQLLTLIPVSLFCNEGIPVITLTDGTLQYALEHIRVTIVEMNRLDRDAFFRLITDSLRILGTNHGLDFGLIP